MFKRGLIILAVLTVSSATVLADIYKWTDADGKVHYSNTPPPQVDAKKVNVSDPIPPTGPGTPAPTVDYWRQKDEEFRKRQEEKSKPQKEASDKAAADDAEKRKQACEFYRRDLDQVLNTRERVTRSADGKDIVVDQNSAPMDTKQRARLIGELNEKIEKNCK